MEVAEGGGGPRLSSPERLERPVPEAGLAAGVGPGTLTGSRPLPFPQPTVPLSRGREVEVWGLLLARLSWRGARSSKCSV